MSHTPYGYVIKDGAAYIDEEQTEKIKKLFDGYISGLALQPAAEKAGLDLYHGSVGRMLRNKRYLGDGYYPPIIDTETFNKVEEIRSFGGYNEKQVSQGLAPCGSNCTRGALLFFVKFCKDILDLFNNLVITDQV